MRRLVFFEKFGDALEDGDQLWGDPDPVDTPESRIAEVAINFIVNENGCGLTEKQIHVVREMLAGVHYREIGEAMTPQLSPQAVRRNFARARERIIRFFAQNPGKADEWGLFR